MNHDRVPAPVNSTLGETFAGGARNVARITLGAAPLAGLIALAVALVFSTSGPAAAATETLVQGLRTPVVALLGGPSGVAVGALTARGKHLFRYVENR